MRTYPNLIYYNKVDKGGHFAAWLVAQIMRRLHRLAPVPANRTAALLTDRFESPPPSPFDEPGLEPRRISRELQRILDAPPPRPLSNEAVVRKILRDL